MEEWSDDDYDVEEHDGGNEEGREEPNGTRPAATARAAEEILKAATSRAVRNATSAPRRPRAPPYSASTLLGSRGFRVLRHRAVSLAASTKDEVQDLDQVMRLYREWAHYMYPKFVFRDFVDKTERLCRTAPMKAYLGALKHAQAEAVAASTSPDFDELRFVAEQDAQQAMAALDPPPDDLPVL